MPPQNRVLEAPPCVGACVQSLLAVQAALPLLVPKHAVVRLVKPLTVLVPVDSASVVKLPTIL